MTNPMINPQPNYSGVTIQISNPAVNVGGASEYGATRQGNCNYCTNPQYYQGIGSQVQSSVPVGSVYPQQIGYENQGTIQNQPAPYPIAGQAYPAQYYLNNYNYQNNGVQGKKPQGDVNPNLALEEGANHLQDEAISQAGIQSNEVLPSYKEDVKEEVQDFTKSNNIIDELNARQAEEKEKQKNTKEKRVVALTDEYIMSLENYLNNQNSEVRLMASKEILKRLDEDKNRFDDAALNALLNKMLQDPSKLIRVAAMSAFASRLACGNDYTVQLLKNMQANPSADKEDVLQAADILLKMSSTTEIKHVPIPEAKKKQNIEPEVEPEPNIKPIDRQEQV